MDQINSFNSYYTPEKPTMVDPNFEFHFNFVFLKTDLVNKDDDDELLNDSYLDKRYFNSNNSNDKDNIKDNSAQKNDKIYQIPGVEHVKDKFTLKQNEIEEFKPSISLDEDSEEHQTFQFNSKKSDNNTSYNNEIISGETKSFKPPSTSDNSHISEKKKNIFELDNFKGFNIFHPGGKEKFYERIKNEIKDLDKIHNIKPPLMCKFKVKTKTKKPNKRKRKERINRKYKPDNIRKKIKSRFFKAIKNRLNRLLKEANSEEFFELLPQCFIINITKKKNQPVMNMSFKTVLCYDFIKEEKNEANNKKDFLNKMRIDIKKYEKNVKVIEYLEKNENENILKKSKFDIIGNMTISQLFEEYLKSDEFEKEIVKLDEEERDNINYIKDYIVKSFGFINYFH